MKYTGWCQNDFNVQGYLVVAVAERDEALKGRLDPSLLPYLG
jgi:hypothetical protein